jgi:hypothetical protein
MRRQLNKINSLILLRKSQSFAQKSKLLKNQKEAVLMNSSNPLQMLMSMGQRQAPNPLQQMMSMGTPQRQPIDPQKFAAAATKLDK